MIIQDIDKGKAFDWGKTSKDYAKYRDIYPQEFYDYVLNMGLCKDGQNVLDIGTGTGVLPRNMYRYGAKWTGTDIAENQIEQAKELAKDAGMDIDFFTSKAEDVSFLDNTFDVITACHINTDGEMRFGTCDSRPETVDGKLRFYESWKWTEGEEGTSVIEEI